MYIPEAQNGTGSIIDNSDGQPATAEFTTAYYMQQLGGVSYVIGHGMLVVSYYPSRCHGS